MRLRPPELLIVIAVIAVITVFVLPVARKLDLSILTTVGLIAGGFGLFVLLLQHRNIIDWLRGRRWRNRKDS